MSPVMEPRVNPGLCAVQGGVRIIVRKAVVVGNNLLY